jgi:hypothetical protein
MKIYLTVLLVLFVVMAFFGLSTVNGLSNHNITSGYNIALLDDDTPAPAPDNSNTVDPLKDFPIRNQE